jgi:uncharacterized repeat protein (TIGR03803 family)
LYSFKASSDGNNPEAGLVMDANGNLYGTTAGFGIGDDNGTVFRLTPPSAGTTGWTFTLLHRFAGGSDGSMPVSALIIDAAGALYGTTAIGGQGCQSAGCGTLFKLTPPAAGGSVWTRTVLYAFQGGSDGAGPQAALTMDATGALYGTTAGGGSACDCGTVFKVLPR